MLSNYISSEKIFSRGKVMLQALAVLMATQSVLSCKKLVEVSTPVNKRDAETVFTTNATANAAVNGMYSSLSQSTNFVFNGNITQFLGMSADEFYYTTSKANYDQFTANTLPTINNSDNYGLWSNPYAIIYQSNAIIEGLAATDSNVSDSLKKQYTGEAKFVRAFSHFYLTNLYGKVPLITTTDVNVTATEARTAVDDVYAKVIEDLQYAYNNLAADYKYSPTAGDRTRVNKWAAAAMLSRVYLYRSQWDSASRYASLVIDSAGLYSLVPDIAASSPFYKNSTEAIWQYYCYLTTTSGYTEEGYILRPTTTNTACYALRDTLLHTFETGDKRKTNWTMSFTPSGSTTSYTVPVKYKNNSTTSNTGGTLEGYTVLRLAELYLIRAEARAHLSNFTGAASDINVIRTRAGLTGIAAADGTTMLAAVAKERQIELFAEMGHRWLDLKRTGTADAVLSVIKPTSWKSTAVLYPVPEEASKSNPNLLPQNNGY